MALVRRPLAALLGVTFVLGAGGLPAVASTADDASPAAPRSDQVSRPDDAEVTSGRQATFEVDADDVADAAFAWEYSIDSGATWRLLPGKTTSTLTVSAITARDGWKLRARVSNESGVAWSHSAWLRVHSTARDPFPTTAGPVGPRLSGWDWFSTWSGTTASGVRAAATWTKRDAGALVSDVHVAYRDAGGSAYPVTVTKASVTGKAVRVSLSAKAPASVRGSAEGDVWKVRDAVTGESEYFAADPSVAKQAAWKGLGAGRFARPVGVLQAQVDGLPSKEIDTGEKAAFELSSRRLRGATITWAYSPDDMQTWHPLAGKSGSRITVVGTAARSWWGVRANVVTSGGRLSTDTWLVVNSSLADPYPNGHVALLADEQVGNWSVGLTATTRATRSISLEVHNMLPFYDASPTNVVVWFHDHGGAWTKARVTMTQLEDAPPGNYVMRAVAAPSAAAIASSSGDVWRITDTALGVSQFFVAG